MNFAWCSYSRPTFKTTAKMPRTINNRKIMVISYSEYCLNNQIKKNDFWAYILPDGSSNYVSRKTGEVMSKKEIDEMYPTPSELWFSENAEKKYNYLSGRKSY